MLFGLFNKANVKGAIGEGFARLYLMGLNRKEYKVLNNITLQTAPGKTSQMDHVIVSVYGIFVIETKNYQGWIFGNEKDQQWTQVLYRNNYKFYNPIKQNQGHIYALQNIIHHKSIPFISIISFDIKATLKDIQVDSDHVSVVYMNQVNKIIRSVTTPVLTLMDVENIVKRIKVRNKKDMKSEHISNTRAAIKEKNESTRCGICPKCSHELVIRSGPYGKFQGCSNYPKCTFKDKV